MMDPEPGKPDSSLLWVAVLCLVIIVGGDYLVRTFRPRQEPQPSNQTSQTVVSKAEEVNLQRGVATSVEGRAPAVSASPQRPKAEVPLRPLSYEEALTREGRRVTIESPTLKGSLLLKGAVLDDLTLVKYTQTPKKEKNVRLLQPLSSCEAYGALWGWSSLEGFGDGSGDTALMKSLSPPGLNAEWRVVEGEGVRLTPDTPLTLFWENAPQTVRYEHVVSLDKKGMFQIVSRVINKSKQPLRLRFWGALQRSKPSKPQESLVYEGPLGYIDGALKEVSYEEMAEKGTRRFKTDSGWLGIGDKYWLAAWVPQGGFDSVFAHKPGRLSVDVGFEGGDVFIQPGFIKEVTHHFFAGAKDLKVLDAYEKKEKIPHFDLAIDFGWFYFLTKPIFYTLSWLTQFTGNFGVAILLFTVLLKLLFFPMANKSYRSMAKMKLLAPEMERLKVRYRDDSQRMGQELMAFYKKEKVNPVSGCLPMLLQIPFFFALYKVLLISIEARHAPFWGGIIDLSAPDPSNLFTLFGLLPFTLPSFLSLGFWPLLMGISMFVQQKMSPPPGDPSQRVIFLYAMPLVFTFMFRNFAAGVVIYWTWNNLISMAQQWAIGRMAERETKGRFAKS